MDNKHASELLKKYNSGQCTDEEKWLIEKSFFEFNEQEVDISFEKLQTLKKQIFKGLPKPKRKIKPLNISIAAIAAAAVITLTIYLFLPGPEAEINESLRLAEKIFPKGHIAQITFSNGKTIELKQNKEEIKVSESELIYGDGSKVNSNYQTESQTISTPRGGEYKIVLSDGTKVWLNAATSLQYPTSFRECAERRVNLVSGEAYFEVSKDKAHPFIVSTAEQNVTVLGTSFNIKAYTKNIKTTLLEGAVRLNLSNKSKDIIETIHLRPNEQSTNDGKSLIKAQADTDFALAWKNGKIKFRNADLQSILSEAERWYDVEVRYNGKVPDIQLTGGISRNSSLATMLKLLQKSGVHFSMEENDHKPILHIDSYN